MARLLGWNVRTPFPHAVEAVVKYRWPEQDFSDFRYFEPGLEQEGQWTETTLQRRKRLVRQYIRDRNYSNWRTVSTPVDGIGGNTGGDESSGFDADAARSAAPFLSEPTYAIERREGGGPNGDEGVEGGAGHDVESDDADVASLLMSVVDLSMHDDDDDDDGGSWDCGDSSVDAYSLN